jgi:hypothetical protein
MTVIFYFGGWFQCRLATDPDPSDEPRGVSGYVHAVAGEPDLDRILRLQPAGTVRRQFCPEIGVTVHSVVVDGATVADHPLVGAEVDLLDNPVFEGRNGIVADTGFEPIVPFHLQVSKGSFRLHRRHLDSEEFPFGELQATGVQPGTTDITEATGIADLAAVWRGRKVDVDRMAQETTDEVTRTALTARSRLLGTLAFTRFFGARMLYAISLRGSGGCDDPDSVLPGRADTSVPWLVDAWLGGWDADALSGYLKGSLQVEAADSAIPAALHAGETTAEVPFAPPPGPPREPRRP